MGIALYVELEDEHPINHVLGDHGKTLVREGETLQELVAELGCQPLEAFWYHGEVDLPPDFDGDPDWLAEIAEEAGLPVLWFDPEEGLSSVSALRQGTEPGSRLDLALEALGQALDVGRQRGTRFHFSFVH
ncbi:MAG: hypothetical protein JJ863_09970 [Deltaproteobacteria bacterium]|nr:hypothetical protein [Deltaproteobacteria bacterium]